MLWPCGRCLNNLAAYRWPSIGCLPICVVQQMNSGHLEYQIALCIPLEVDTQVVQVQP